MNLMNASDMSLRELLLATRVIPVVAVERVEYALPLADALLAGGLPCVEVTFRTAAAAEVIRLLARERPSLVVGAGTVITRESLEAAQAAGARFAVAPGLNAGILNRAKEVRLPFLPGVATPSEIETALAAGFSTLKFFPAEQLGGVEMLKALVAPYGHAGARFVPTGGIKPENLEHYLLCPGVLAVGGTWLAKADDMAAGRWADISQRCAVAVDAVQRLRPRLSS